MTATPLVTVIMPVCNSAAFLPESIRSLKQQTLEELEILFIDDGSTDDSAEICRQACREDVRFRLLLQEHRGVSAARNLGIEEARGTYLFFLDSDDRIHPELLRRQSEAMTAEGADIAGVRYFSFSDQYDRRETGSSLRLQMGQLKALPGLLDLADAEKEQAEEEFRYRCFPADRAIGVFHQDRDILDTSQYGNIGGIGGKMIRRTAIGRQHFPEDICLGEDSVFMFRVLGDGCIILMSVNCWYYYRRHTSSAMFRKHVHFRHGYAEACRVIFEAEMDRGNLRYAAWWYMTGLGRFCRDYIYSIENHLPEETREMRRAFFTNLLQPRYRRLHRSRTLRIGMLLCLPTCMAPAVARRFLH